MEYICLWRIDKQPIQVSYFDKKAVGSRGYEGFRKHLEEVYGKKHITYWKINKINKISR